MNTFGNCRQNQLPKISVNSVTPIIVILYVYSNNLYFELYRMSDATEETYKTQNTYNRVIDISLNDL